MQKIKKVDSEISYSEARKTDEDEIRNMLRSLGGDESNFELSRFVVAKSGKRLIGCGRIKVVSKDCLELASLGVLSECQKRGIGSHLVRELLAKEKYRPILLLTSSDKENFYKKLGAVIIAPESLPQAFKEEYRRIIALPFAEKIRVIAMRFE
jgi:N-acetylglutamate synthase-like GNAT family acetyltransferase